MSLSDRAFRKGRRMKVGETIRERLLYNIEIITESGCWLWVGSLTTGGYGNLSVNYKNKPCHRLSYTEFVGEIPEGMLVCHRCDVPSCINPNHLFLGTYQDNMDDMVKKGRARGRNSPPR